MDYNFDLARIFFGEAETADALFFVEIVFRTTVMYLYTIFLARMVGHDAIGQIGPFEFVLVIAVGSAAGDPMFYPEIGLLQGILVITVVILLHRLTGAALQRSRRLERAVEGDPVLMIAEGRIRKNTLGSGSLTEREVLALLRVDGIRDVGEVERAYFETNGRLSVFRYAAEKSKRVRSTYPDEVET
ncbi:MAG TPA: YetF domain-containing protein [Mesorhizobium sp.]|jgi:uncharacterized membrane protein YcaP (DUF421 family)